MPLAVELVQDISTVNAGDWDALTGEDDPFVEHAFLLALEKSGSVGEGSGWMPLHVTVRDEGRLIGALPLYVKFHSYGEYIFDWSWANAAERSGLRYYPKLVSMVPFTPVTGRRLLMAEGADPDDITQALLAGVQAAAEEVKASSFHVLFLTETERALVSNNSKLMSRLSNQFHWKNKGYESFEHYLSYFRSAQRKQVRRERRRVKEAGLEIRVLGGDELGQEEWDALCGFYMDTCHRRGSGPYLTHAFFEEIARTHAHRVVAALAYNGSRPVAATLNFQKGKHLYGRYWGCSEDHQALHFELCYYRLLERAIDQGLSRFEAGAQGMHKLRRGLMPAAIHSAHWIGHPGLCNAIAEFLPREEEAVREELIDLARHSPFKRG